MPFSTPIELRRQSRLCSHRREKQYSPTARSWRLTVAGRSRPDAGLRPVPMTGERAAMPRTRLRRASGNHARREQVSTCTTGDHLGGFSGTHRPRRPGGLSARRGHRLPRVHLQSRLRGYYRQRRDGKTPAGGHDAGTLFRDPRDPGRSRSVSWRRRTVLATRPEIRVPGPDTPRSGVDSEWASPRNLCPRSDE